MSLNAQQARFFAIWHSKVQRTSGNANVRYWRIADIGLVDEEWPLWRKADIGLTWAQWPLLTAAHKGIQVLTG